MLLIQTITWFLVLYWTSPLMESLWKVLSKVSGILIVLWFNILIPKKGYSASWLSSVMVSWERRGITTLRETRWRRNKFAKPKFTSILVKNEQNHLFAKNHHSCETSKYGEEKKLRFTNEHDNKSPRPGFQFASNWTSSKSSAKWAARILGYVWMTVGKQSCRLILGQCQCFPVESYVWMDVWMDGCIHQNNMSKHIRISVLLDCSTKNRIGVP